MRIGINALCVTNRSGTGRYAAQLLAALAALPEAGEHEFRVCLPADASSDLARLLTSRPNFGVTAVCTDSLWRRLRFERWGLVPWIASQRLDLFHGPAFVVPAGCPVPSVVTVHDLVFDLFPQTVPWTRRAHYRREIPRSARAARLVLCDSGNTARDARERLGIAPERLRTVHLGVEERFFAAPGAAAAQRVREALRLPERFWLTVGTLEPRKNIPGLLAAYARVAADREEVPPLAIAGRQGWGLRNLRRLAASLGVAARVHFPGFVPDDDLPVLYHLADLFVHASLYEGFGLPVLEAMAAGTPVIAGGNSSIPEVAGGAACLTDVRDTEAMARALAAFAENPAAARALAVLARQRAAEFTWAATARRTLAAYGDAVR